MRDRSAAGAPSTEPASDLRPLDRDGYFAVDADGNPWALYDDGSWERIFNPGRYVRELLARAEAGT